MQRFRGCPSIIFCDDFVVLIAQSPDSLFSETQNQIR